MSDEADAQPVPGGRHRAVLLAVGVAVVTTAVLVLVAPALPAAARIGVGLVALLAGVALVAVALLPLAGAPWLRPAFWAVVAGTAVPVAVVGDMGVRVPALLIGALALAQCVLGVLVWRRRA